MHYTIIKSEKLILYFFAFIALFISCTNTKKREEPPLEVAQATRANVEHDSEDESTQDAAIVPATKANKPDSVQIHYTNTINNYKVSVAWYPEGTTCGSSVRGKGILLFTHTTGAQFEVTHNNFYLKDVLPLNEKTGELLLSSQKDFTIDYTPYTDTTQFINSDLPFLFYDTNFDGKKELVLIHPCLAQRFRDYLAVYAINDQYTLVDSAHQITGQRPYRSFDSYSKFNKQDKTVTLHLSGGASTYEERIYKRNKIKNQLQLERVEGADMDSTYVFQRPFDMSEEALMTKIGDHINYFGN